MFWQNIEHIRCIIICGQGHSHSGLELQRKIIKHLVFILHGRGTAGQQETILEQMQLLTLPHATPHFFFQKN